MVFDRNVQLFCNLARMTPAGSVAQAKGGCKFQRFNFDSLFEDFSHSQGGIEAA